MIGKNSEVKEICDQNTTINAQVARLIYDARTEAGMSQTQLAQIIDPTQSVISRLEDAEYEGLINSSLNTNK